MDRAWQEHSVSCENPKTKGWNAVFLPHMSERVDAGRVRGLAPPDLSDVVFIVLYFPLLREMGGGGFFCYVNEVIFVKCLSKATLIRGLELPVQPMTSREGRGAGD